MIKEYAEELEALTSKMVGAEKFAEALQIFSKQIISDKLTATDSWIRFGNFYRGMSFAWGINRGHFSHDSKRTITNYGNGKYDEYLFSIYINTLNIYDSHRKYDLDKVLDIADIFFYDKMNTVFYVKDDHIECFLDAIVEWKNEAVERAIGDAKEGKIAKLQNEIDRLNA